MSDVEEALVRSAEVVPPAAGPRRRNLLLFESLLLVCLVWVGYTVFAIADHGLVGFVKAAFDNTAVIQVAVDLAFSIVIALVFIAPDAKRRGLPFAPYAGAAALTGSIGLLAYLLHRTWRGR
jgi:hypothetical protein